MALLEFKKISLQISRSHSHKEAVQLSVQTVAGGSRYLGNDASSLLYIAGSKQS